MISNRGFTKKWRTLGCLTKTVCCLLVHDCHLHRYEMSLWCKTVYGFSYSHYCPYPALSSNERQQRIDKLAENGVLISVMNQFEDQIQKGGTPNLTTSHTPLSWWQRYVCMCFHNWPIMGTSWCPVFFFTMRAPRSWTAACALRHHFPAFWSF